MDTQNEYIIDGGHLNIDDVIQVAKKKCLVQLSEDTYSRMNEARNIVEKWLLKKR